MNGTFLGTETSRADCAEVCVAAAESPLCANTTFELATDAKVEVTGVSEALFAELKPRYLEE